jgi:uncharacterized protein with PIN domain
MTTVLIITTAAVYVFLIGYIIRDAEIQKYKYATAISNFERCVSCNTIIAINKSTPIKERLYYVQGSGQLCRDCHEEVYPK